MSRDKQIEEMTKVLEGVTRWEEARLGYYRSKAVALYNAGYRKASDVAEEIFAEIEDLLRKHYVEWDFCYFEDYLGEDFAELKKKYIGKDTNVITTTEEGK